MSLSTIDQPSIKPIKSPPVAVACKECDQLSLKLIYGRCETCAKKYRIHMTVIKLKLKLTTQQSKILDDLATICNKGRNAAEENWLLRNRGLPETIKQKNKSESNKLYHTIIIACPTLNTTIASKLGQEVIANLNSKLDWRRRNGTNLKRKEAILANIDNLSTYRSYNIPIISSASTFEFVDVPTLSFTGFKNSRIIVELSTKELSQGHKNYLRKLVHKNDIYNEIKMPDSKLVKRDDEWFWHILRRDEVKLGNQDVQAELYPIVEIATDKQSDRPYKLILPGRDKPWFIGEGRYLIRQTERLTLNRKMVSERFKFKSVRHGKKGHGRRKYDKAISQRNTYLRNIRDNIRNKMISDIINQCERYKVGKLIYHEPTGPAKLKCWFHNNGLDWDWTSFCTRLKNACTRIGVSVEVEQLKFKDINNAIQVAV